ncbi:MULTISPECIES: FadR/GntR family transcriptional regulator [Virgibacillus]|uniref:L-lactate utilization operon repressor n=2 Tax=Virgibacillus TaxID=84406 RepID=A0A024Q8G5_9BACI|nr:MULTISPECIES: FCD domain-containing protein [Virgibacillus]EQB37639.1 hypothetical protein M948_03550 [Virgibacillus sp. CM-4]MYL40380.1 FCD domain-containing protein [Virgibacillus massiliensis]GGJ59472.1 GntR family transcriptional regulator [Virgibacillus kapii]CDQ38833.1 L-lactate utilization operon repressor [Virgibacillus massiliensis]
MKAKKQSLVEVVIERIKKSIIDNNLKPNDKFLSEGELVEQLQVSRTVIREALISLQALGILKVKAGGGVFVADTKLYAITSILKHHYETYGVKIKELVEIRKIIELGALRLIIEKNIDVNLEAFYGINHSYYQSIINNNNTNQYDNDFHQLLIKTTQNETFYHFSEIINEYFLLAKMDLFQKEEDLMKSYDEHTQIIKAVAEKDLTKAQQTITQHFNPIFTFIKQMEEES